jgi:hypothetical protein
MTQEFRDVVEGDDAQQRLGQELPWTLHAS